TVWHRTGDLARFDEHSNLWLLGRTADQVRMSGRDHPCFAVEAEALALGSTRQAALVQAVHDGPPTLRYALEPDTNLPAAVEAELCALLTRNGFAGTKLQRLAKLPVDRRHNSKIDRAKLRRRL